MRHRYLRIVSVAFVIRRGGALWRVSELLSQLTFSMRSGMFFFDCNSAYAASFLRIVYSSLASLDFIGETNWCSPIRSLLFRANHRDVWENHRVENANRLIKQVKLCLIDTYKVDWSSKARNSIKLRTYIKVQIRPLARRISALHPRHKVDKGTINIKNELTYARS